MAPFLIVCFFALVESSKIRFETEAERELYSRDHPAHHEHHGVPRGKLTQQDAAISGRKPAPSPRSAPPKKTKKRVLSQMAVSADGEIIPAEDPEETNTDQQGSPKTAKVDAEIYEYGGPKSDQNRNPAEVLQDESEASQHRQLENGEPANHHKNLMQQTMRIEESEGPDTLVESGSMVSTKHRHRDVNAPVLGGVIGGVLVVALIMLAYKRYSEMRIRHRTQDLRSPTPSSATPPSPREVERQNDRTPSKPERPTKIDYAAVRSRK